MNTMNFIMTKKEEVYNDGEKFDKKINNELINNYENLSQDEKDLFFINNSRLVAFEVRKISGESDIIYEELMSTGLIGLHKAIKHYDKNKGYVFASFAARCIRNEILMFLRKEKKHKNISSLNYVLYEDDNSNLTIEDTICDSNSNPVEDVYKKIMFDKVTRLFPELTELDVNILINYYGLNNNEEKTLAEIANELGYAQSYMSRRKQKVLQKIKNIIED